MSHGLLRAEIIERFLPVGGRDDLVLRQGEEVHQGLNIDRLVVHHQNTVDRHRLDDCAPVAAVRRFSSTSGRIRLTGSSGRLSGVSIARVVTLSGSESVKCDPTPTSDVTLMLPP